MKLRFICSAQHLALVVFFLTALCQAADTESPKSTFEGTWQWTFTMPDAGKVTPTLRLQRKGGAWTGTTRFRTGSSTPVTNITVQGSELSFEVFRERDGQKTATHYRGTVSGDTIKGKVVSDWQGQEESYDWEARRLSDVEGTWKWTTSFGGGPGFENTLTLKRDNEKVTGKFNAGRFGDSDISHGRFRKNELSFEVVRERDGDKFTNFYRGKLSGDTIEGKSITTFGENVRTNDWKPVRAD